MEEVRIIAAVEPPVELIKVAVYMLLADVMKRADNRPFEQGPGVFVIIYLTREAFWFILSVWITSQPS